MSSDTRKIDPRWVYCWECDRGGNGNDPDKCSCGWQEKRKRFNGLGCFAGTRMRQESTEGGPGQ